MERVVREVAMRTTQLLLLVVVVEGVVCPDPEGILSEVDCSGLI
jgi:hypothetical protein